MYIQIQSFTGDIRQLKYSDYQIGIEDNETYNIILCKGTKISTIDVFPCKAVRDMVYKEMVEKNQISLRKMRSPTLGPSSVEKLLNNTQYNQSYLRTAIAKAIEVRNSKKIRVAPPVEWDCFADYTANEIGKLSNGNKIHKPTMKQSITCKLAACLGTPMMVLEMGITPEQFYDYIIL